MGVSGGVEEVKIDKLLILLAAPAGLEPAPDRCERYAPWLRRGWLTSDLGQPLQVLCRPARCEVRFDPKTDLILTPNPVATCLLRPATQLLIPLPRATGRGFIHLGARPERRRTKGY